MRLRYLTFFAQWVRGEVRWSFSKNILLQSDKVSLCNLARGHLGETPAAIDGRRLSRSNILIETAGRR